MSRAIAAMHTMPASAKNVIAMVLLIGVGVTTAAATLNNVSALDLIVNVDAGNV